MTLQELLGSFLELSIKEKLVLGTIVLFLACIQAILFRLSVFKLIVGSVLLQTAIFFFLERTTGYFIQVHLFYLIPSLILSFFVYALLPSRKSSFNDREVNPWRIKIPVKSGSPVVIENIKRGIAIFGSGGAGKTESVFIPIISNAAKCNITGINYDYKDGELSEILNYFYSSSQVKTYTIIPHKPEISYRVNPVDPSYIDSPEMVNELVSVLFRNLRKRNSSSQDNFFTEVPEATLAAAIWRLKSDYPEYCTLPHAIAICLVKKARDLADFLKQNSQSRLMASPFFDSLEAKEQMAGVKASMSNDLRKFAFPSIFYVLSGNEVNLRVNHPDSPGMINLVNCPGKEITLSPFLALIFTTTLKLMQKRDMRNSYLLMDEAATMNLPSFSRIPATMRSFNIATVYSLQDKVLGTEQYGDITARAILANLSYQFIGKTNDPESVKYYKQIVEEIEKKQISKSYGTGFIPKGETRKTESTRETTKYKNQDFFGLNAGEFLVLADGKDRKVKFDLMPFERVQSKVRNHVTNRDLETNYEEILKTASRL